MRRTPKKGARPARAVLTEWVPLPELAEEGEPGEELGYYVRSLDGLEFSQFQEATREAKGEVESVANHDFCVLAAIASCQDADGKAAFTEEGDADWLRTWPFYLLRRLGEAFGRVNRLDEEKPAKNSGSGPNDSPS
jgi:hypothetical protein